MMRPHGSLAVILGCCAALVAGCGVVLDAEPMALPSGIVPSPASSQSSLAANPSPNTQTPMAASPTPTTNEARVWFVREDGLAPLTVPIDGENGAADLLVALAAGPPAGAGDGTLRTVARDPVTGNALASVPPDIEGGEADVASAVTVQLSPAFASLPSGEQILLLGQIVLTVTGSGIGFVAFVDDAGIPAAVPLPDGRLLDGPAKARDYASLIAQL